MPRKNTVILEEEKKLVENIMKVTWKIENKHPHSNELEPGKDEFS